MWVSADTSAADRHAATGSPKDAEWRDWVPDLVTTHRETSAVPGTIDAASPMRASPG